MNMRFERLNVAVDEMTDNNLTVDMTEGQIAELIYGEGPFSRTMSSACPTSFLICC